MQVLARVVSAPPRDPRSLRPDLPADLARVCQTALAKDPRDRYPSAQAFAAALRDPRQATSPATRRSRRRAAVGAGVGALLLVLAGVVGLREGDAPPRVAATPRPSVDPAQLFEGQAIATFFQADQVLFSSEGNRLVAEALVGVLVKGVQE